MPKTSDITDKEILREIYISCVEHNCWSNTTIIAESFSDFPIKIVASKLSRVMLRGLVTGCDCGCRGDWELTTKGYELISEEPWRDNPMEYDETSD